MANKDKKLGEASEIVLQEYSQPIGEQVHAFRGWLVGRALGKIGLANEVPECRIYLREGGGVVVTFRDVIPNDHPDDESNEFDDETSWALVLEYNDWDKAWMEGGMNAHGGYSHPFEQAWEAAQAFR